ncbi:hypothetical protein IFU20_01225 [Pseudomonas viridiflava]|uniref:DUF6388 family protein n=1 Tax=Pseudomonas syringae group TaxID=136849 RepID=UPI00071003C9|nr:MULTISPECIES: DUF6388 family protein [Pseudomonas syringae group]MBD8184788.1 hypothetical protein [Pseudomonas viridiflava]
MSISNRYQAAHDKYFAGNPEAAAEIESVSVRMLDNLGITMEEWRKTQRYLVFAKAAEANGFEIDEFVIHLMAESPGQAHAWRLERQRRLADALGIPWDEYRQLNRISEEG